MIPTLLASPAFFGLGIPIIFLFAGALTNKLVRRGGGWEQSDFFLSIEAALAVMSSALVNVSDLVREATLTRRPVDSIQLAATAGFLALDFLILLFFLVLHQESQLRDWGKWKRFLARSCVKRFGLGTNVCFHTRCKGVTLKTDD